MSMDAPVPIVLNVPAGVDATSGCGGRSEKAKSPVSPGRKGRPSRQILVKNQRAMFLKVFFLEPVRRW